MAGSLVLFLTIQLLCNLRVLSDAGAGTDDSIAKRQT
jgi:hypothetical protein